MFDPAVPPEPAALSAQLGSAASQWEYAIAATRRRAPQLSQTWHFAGPKIGWSLRLLQGARILVYLTPEPDQFRVGLVLGGKAVVAARAAGMSATAAAIIDRSPKYAEGYGVRFQVATAEDLLPLEELLGMKFLGRSVPSNPAARP